MPQLNFALYPAQIFWLIISFGILFCALKFWLLPPIETILKQREDKIKNILREADKLSVQADKVNKEYQQYVDEAAQYSARVVQTAHNEIATNYAKQEEELLQILKTDTQKAESTLEDEKEKVLGALENIAFNFVQGLLKVFYQIKKPAKSLKKEVSDFIKGKSNG